jgi:hypothetical protein
LLNDPGQNFLIYAKRKETQETQNGYPQAQKAPEKEPSQEKIILKSNNL